jgi:hypothetical protein
VHALALVDHGSETEEVPLEAGADGSEWMTAWDEANQREYFYNVHTGESTYVLPA